MEDFIKMLKGVKPDIDFEHETALVDDGLLESLDIISIISEISEGYGSQVMRSFRITSIPQRQCTSWCRI